MEKTKQGIYESVSQLTVKESLEDLMLKDMMVTLILGISMQR